MDISFLVPLGKNIISRPIDKIVSLRSCKTVLQNDYNFPFLPTMDKSFCCNTFLLVFCAISVLYFSHYNTYADGIHHCFNPQFLKDIKYCIPFHLLLCHSYLDGYSDHMSTFNQLFLFLLLSFKRFLYTLDTI